MEVPQPATHLHDADPAPGTDQLIRPPETLTFTGVDAHTSIAAAAEMHARYPATEFAVLAGGRTERADTHRFPPRRVLDQWLEAAAEHKLDVALHLCDRISRSIMAGADIEHTANLCSGARRVQINARNYNYHQIEEFANIVSCESVIVQHRDRFQYNMPSGHPKIEYLYDRSGGRGRTSFDSWTEPVNTRIKHGYAGGLDRSNIERALHFIRPLRTFRIWLDMESSIRDENDHFDIRKAETISYAVFRQ